MNNNFIKGIGLVTSLVGLGAALLGDWVNDKKMEERIEEKVNEALSDQEKENEEES